MIIDYLKTHLSIKDNKHLISVHLYGSFKCNVFPESLQIRFISTELKQVLNYTEKLYILLAASPLNSSGFAPRGNLKKKNLKIKYF